MFWILETVLLSTQADVLTDVYVLEDNTILRLNVCSSDSMCFMETIRRFFFLIFFYLLRYEMTPIATLHPSIQVMIFFKLFHTKKRDIKVICNVI